MNEPSETPPSKGMAMIASYRAARLSQRSVFRSSLQQTHVARRMARAQEKGRPEPAPPASVDEPVIAAADPVVAEVVEAGSVFANLVSSAVAERPADPAPIEAAAAGPTTPPSADPVVADREQTAPEPDVASHAEALPEAANAAPEVLAQPSDAVYDPPLAEIGFGPGMLIRLSQLGLHTTAELAQADAGELRAALGEISRLVDVEAWIANARHKAASA